MASLVILAVIGLAAQFVDGSLGMAYGVTSTTLLLAAGIAPASASAAVHLAEVGTTLVSGISHWRFRNVDWGVVARIAIPGGAGAFAGATFLSSISTEAGAPLMAGILLALGCYLLIRFTLRGLPTHRLGQRVRTRYLTPLGLVAGFVDSTGGGGWGPVATPSLLASGRMEPRKVIGSVDTSEFVVAVCASAGFLIGLGQQNIPLDIVLALLIGGVLAAPLAAWVVRHLPARILGSAVGGVIILTNARTLLGSDWVNAPGPLTNVVLLGVLALWGTAIAWSVRAYRQERHQERPADSDRQADPLAK